MKKVSFAVVGVIALALAACGHKEDANAAENAVVTDNIDVAVENIGNGTDAVAVEETTQVTTANGTETVETVDESDVNAAQINAM